jgi:hypothetical protein
MTRATSDQVVVLQQAINRGFRDKISFRVGEARRQLPWRQLRLIQRKLYDLTTHIVRNSVPDAVRPGRSVFQGFCRNRSQARDALQAAACLVGPMPCQQVYFDFLDPETSPGWLATLETRNRNGQINGNSKAGFRRSVGSRFGADRLGRQGRENRSGTVRGSQKFAECWRRNPRNCARNFIPP